MTPIEYLEDKKEVLEADIRFYEIHIVDYTSKIERNKVIIEKYEKAIKILKEAEKQ